MCIVDHFIHTSEVTGSERTAVGRAFKKQYAETSRQNDVPDSEQSASAFIEGRDLLQDGPNGKRSYYYDAGTDSLTQSNDTLFYDRFEQKTPFERAAEESVPYLFLASLSGLILSGMLSCNSGRSKDAKACLFDLAMGKEPEIFFQEKNDGGLRVLDVDGRPGDMGVELATPALRKTPFGYFTKSERTLLKSVIRPETPPAP